MSLTASLSSIKINDNIVDIGYSYNGSTVANYTYSNSMIVNGPAIITNNTLSGAIGSSTSYILQISASCIITNNCFIRGVGSPITKYIEIINNEDQVIKDNIFDQPTIDGSSDILVTGLSTKSIYHSNKNQTIYVPVTWFDSITDMPANATDTIFGFASFTLTNPQLIRSNNYLRYQRTNTDASTLVAMIPICNHVPEGATLLECKIGLSSTANTVTFNGTGNNNFIMTLTSQQTISSLYSTGTNSVLDVFNRRNTVAQTVTTTYDMAANTVALQGATQYVTLTPTLLDFFINNGDNIFSLFISCKVVLTAVTSLTHFFSPIVMKCRW